MSCSFAELTFTRLQEAQKYVEFVICPKKYCLRSRSASFMKGTPPGTILT